MAMTVAMTMRSRFHGSVADLTLATRHVAMRYHSNLAEENVL